MNTKLASIFEVHRRPSIDHHEKEQGKAHQVRNVLQAQNTFSDTSAHEKHTIRNPQSQEKFEKRETRGRKRMAEVKKEQTPPVKTVTKPAPQTQPQPPKTKPAKPQPVPVTTDLTSDLQQLKAITKTMQS